MMQNMVAHIRNPLILEKLERINEELDLMSLNIDDYEEFFHVLLHLKPVMFIVEINDIKDPYLKIIKIIRKSVLTKHVPIIVISNTIDETIINKVAEMDISALVHMPVIDSVLKLNIVNILRRSDEKQQLEVTQDLQSVQSVMISGLASLSEYRDPETGQHIKRTQNYVKALAVTLRRKGLFTEELTDSNIDAIYMSVPLHDIGKVGIRDEILLKPGRLNQEEFEIMKTHTRIGYDAIHKVGNSLKNSDFLNYAADVAYTHHEKYDGSGYPRGLMGDDIPLVGRLMAVADVYDALVSKRVYKEAMTHEEAMEIIREGSGSHFDPEIVSCALDLEKTFSNIAQTYSDTEVHDPNEHFLEDLKKKGLLNKVLIVEDSKIVRMVMKNQLMSMGIQVDEAMDGVTGFDKIMNTDYDLVLLDIEMPKMNGYQMVTKLRREMKLPIIIAMTAADYNVTLRELHELGIEGLLLKPVDLNRLASKYEEVLYRKGK